MDARTTPSHERPLRCTPRACHRPRTGETTTGNRRRGTTAPRAHGSDERRERSVHLRQGVPPHPQQSGVLFQALPRRPPALIGSRRLFGEIVERSLELRRRRLRLLGSPLARRLHVLALLVLAHEFGPQLTLLTAHMSPQHRGSAPRPGLTWLKSKST